MRLLGAILAGGQSRRFGSDKAQALLGGKALLDHVVDALRPQTDAIVVAGRIWPGIPTVTDLPASNLGPLGGLAGALDYAQRGGYDAVLSSGCDLLGVPHDLIKQLGTGPVVFDKLPIVGLWPAAHADQLVAWLAEPGNRSVYRFADHINARRVTMPASITNVNTAFDLESYAACSKR
jgi:molybdenum cofactor guanylyltransferase